MWFYTDYLKFRFVLDLSSHLNPRQLAESAMEIPMNDNWYLHNHNSMLLCYYIKSIQVAIAI